ncbi:MAG: PASTA domain-containing protein, partial [Armatimonadetes bacterium]|nr:PASTA domain-containing protein [Armatimonadota bacterium]
MNIGGTVAGRYDVQERLGAGALFTVYKGRDRSSGRQVAIKSLLPEARDQTVLVDALRRCAHGLSELAHPNIARVYEVVEDAGAPVLISEFVRGINLKERIKRIAPFTLSVAVDFAASICEALHHAHSSGVIHGDVRPHNVIISPEGVVKVTDFGLARAIAASPDAASRHLSRAVHYQAPETATRGVFVPATDVYALGVMLFEMLTGSLPYPGDSIIHVAMRHQNDPVPSPRSLNPGVPKALEGIVMLAMQKQIERRYASAGDMLTDLRTVRDAFRFGRSLSWSPMETQAPPPAAPEAVATDERKPKAAPEPKAPPAPPTREIPPMPARRSDDDRISPWLRFAIGTMIVVILLGGVFGAALWMATFSRPESRTFPNLVGRPIAEAQRDADKVNVKLIQREEFNDRYEPGIVYRTDYEPGRAIRAGRSVLVWVSRGSRLVWVPDVTRASAEQAESKLKEAGLVPGQVNRQYSETVPYGTVISQNPRSGKRVDRDTPVALVLSDGPESGAETEPGIEEDVDAEHTWNITHHVRRDGLGPRQVRVEYEDSQGSATAFDEVRSEGDPIRVQVNGRGPTLIVRIYYSDDPIPVSERTQ